MGQRASKTVRDAVIKTATSASTAKGKAMPSADSITGFHRGRATPQDLLQQEFMIRGQQKQSQHQHEQQQQQQQSQQEEPHNTKDQNYRNRNNSTSGTNMEMAPTPMQSNGNSNSNSSNSSSGNSDSKYTEMPPDLIQFMKDIGPLQKKLDKYTAGIHPTEYNDTHGDDNNGNDKTKMVDRSKQRRLQRKMEQEAESNAEKVEIVYRNDGQMKQPTNPFSQQQQKQQQQHQDQYVDGVLVPQSTSDNSTSNEKSATSTSPFHDHTRTTSPMRLAKDVEGYNTLRTSSFSYAITNDDSEDGKRQQNDINNNKFGLSCIGLYELLSTKNNMVSKIDTYQNHSPKPPEQELNHNQKQKQQQTDALTTTLSSSATISDPSSLLLASTVTDVYYQHRKELQKKQKQQEQEVQIQPQSQSQPQPQPQQAINDDLKHNQIQKIEDKDKDNDDKDEDNTKNMYIYDLLRNTILYNDVPIIVKDTDEDTYVGTQLINVPAMTTYMNMKVLPPTTIKLVLHDIYDSSTSTSTSSSPGTIGNRRKDAN